MFAGNTFNTPTFPNPFIKNNPTFNSPFNNTNIINEQNFQTPVTANFHCNNAANMLSNRSPPTNDKKLSNDAETQSNDEMSQNAQNNSTQYSMSSSNENTSSPPRYGLSCDSTTERQANVTPVNNRMQNRLNREFRYESSNNHRNRNSTRNCLNHSQTSANVNNVREQAHEEIELTCMLYSSFENQAKYYLAN